MWQKRIKRVIETKDEAVEYALTLLEMHDHSEIDLRRKLQRRGIDRNLQDEVVAKLREYGLLDAKRYAEAVYDAWLRKKVYGRQHLRAEFVKKNVEPRYVHDLMARLSPEMELERANAALALTQKSKSRKYNLTTQEGVAAAMRFLTARGFDSDVVYAALGRLICT